MPVQLTERAANRLVLNADKQASKYNYGLRNALVAGHRSSIFQLRAVIVNSADIKIRVNTSHITASLPCIAGRAPTLTCVAIPTSLPIPCPVSLMLPSDRGAEARFCLGAAQFELWTLQTLDESCLGSAAAAALARGSGAVAWMSCPGTFVELRCSSGLSRRVGLGGGEYVLSFGWTDEEMLVIVGRSGRLRVFETNGAEVLALDLSAELGVDGEVGVQRLVLASDGCVCLTKAGRALVVEGLSGLDASLPAVYELPCEDLLSQHLVLSCAASSAEGAMRVLLLLDDASLLLCDRFYVDCIDLADLHSITAPLLIALSPNGGFLACCTVNALVILNATFDTKVKRGVFYLFQLILTVS